MTEKLARCQQTHRRRKLLSSFQRAGEGEHRATTFKTSCCSDPISRALGVTLSFSAILISRRMQNAAHSVCAGDVIEFRQQNCLGKRGWTGEVEKGPALPRQIPSLCCGQQRDSESSFEKHGCNLPGNIRDKGELVKVSYLKSECKHKMARSHLDSSRGHYGLNSAP